MLEMVGNPSPPGASRAKNGYRRAKATLSRHPLLGWPFAAWQKLWRIVGVDHPHVNGLGNKFCDSDESVVKSARACLRPLFASMPCTVMPVFSSGQTAKQIPATFEALGSADLTYAAGGGFHGHPDGAAAGVVNLRRAWEKAMGIAALSRREFRIIGGYQISFIAITSGCV